MPKQLLYPTSPESPKFLLKLALSNGFQSTSKLLLTSVVGCWVIALLSYVIQMHLEPTWISVVFNFIIVIAIILLSMIGVMQLNAAYKGKTISDAAAYKALGQKAVGIVLTTLGFIIILWLITWFASTILQSMIPLGHMALGLVRILLGCVFIFFLTSTFLVIPFYAMSNQSFSEIFSDLLHIAITHWLRCFLCLFTWLIVLDLLTGNLALVMMPALQKIPYSLLIIKTISAVIIIPILVSYTTLLVHDFMLRIKEASQPEQD